jgi:hypothetical protein
MKKKWTKEEFIEETRKIMELKREQNIHAKQNARRSILKKMRNKKHAKPKLFRA